MTTTTISPVGTMNSTVPQQEADQTFPSVLVNSTLGAIVSLAGVWVTALLIG